MTQMCYNPREESIIEINYFFNELPNFKLFLKSIKELGIKVVILDNAYICYSSTFEIFLNITPNIKYYLKENVSKQSYILKKIDKNKITNDLYVYKINLTEQDSVNQLQEYIQNNLQTILQYNDILIHIDVVNGEHFAKIKELSKTMHKLIHHIRINYTWDTYSTKFCLEHPCILNICNGTACHLNKSILPRYIVLNNNGEVYPYGIENKRFYITKIKNNTLSFDNYYQSKEYLAYINVQKLIYNNYLISWPFYFFPLGGLVRYGAEQYKCIYK